MRAKNLTLERRKQKLLNELDQFEDLFVCHAHAFDERSRYAMWKWLDYLKKAVKNAKENKND